MQFYVGQLVKVVGPPDCRWLGKPARIVERKEDSRLHSRLEGSRIVPVLFRLDVEGIGRLSPEGRPIGAIPEHLVPIVPDGHRPAEESIEELLPFLKIKEKVHVNQQ